MVRRAPQLLLVVALLVAVSTGGVYVIFQGGNNEQPAISDSNGDGVDPNYVILQANHNGQSAIGDRDTEDIDSNEEDSESYSEQPENHTGAPDRERPEEFEMVVVFRNDDLSPGQHEDAMRDVDEIFIEQEVPVTQGIIPNRTEPLDPESQFCHYLRNRSDARPDLFEFSLHGYTHDLETEFYGGSEFGDQPYEEQSKRITSGIDLLEECVNEEVSTFIPPFDTYDETTVKALTESNITTVSGGSWFTEDYYNDSGIFYTNETLHAPQTTGFVKNWTTGELYDLEEMKETFDHKYENDSIYIQMIHFQYFDREERLHYLREFLEYIRSYEGIVFMTLESFATNCKDGDLERTEDGWSYDPNGTHGEQRVGSEGNESPAENEHRIVEC